MHSFINKFNFKKNKEESIVPISSRKKAVCFGINDYPGTNNDLRGCVNDAKDWGDLLTQTYGFNVQYFLDKQVTYSRFVDVVGNLMSDSKPEDSIVITWSSHGTNVPDMNGDEEEGRDEAICLYDSLIVDDEVYGILKNINPEANLTIISDCCHSGSITRSFMSLLNNSSEKSYCKPRYMPPSDEFEAVLASRSETNRKMFKLEEDINEILITGCASHEFSYDAWIGGSFRGAMSYYSTQILRQQPQITFENFYHRLRSKLPSNNFPQSPQLEGKMSNKNKMMFI